MKEKTDKEEYDIGEHFKEEHDKLTKEIDELNKENKDLKKLLMMCYTFSKIIDDTIAFIPSEAFNGLHQLTSLLRGMSSEGLDIFVFNEPETDYQSESD